jgi:hypothetical protein
MLIRRLLTYSLLSLIALGGFFGNLQIDIGTQTESHIAISYEGNGVYATGWCPWSELPDAFGSCPSGAVNSNDNGLGAPSTWATGKPADATKPADQVKKWNDVIDTLNMALAVLSALISPIILFVGWLMSPDWTSGDLFGLRTPMYALWVTVSNIVYFVYAVMLILIALGTMFGNDKFSYKVMLPKLALGILMVPFTWWFVQWTVSIASVVTASVMTIPQETINAMEAERPSKWFSETESIPKIVTVWSWSTTTADCNKKWECMTPKKFMESSAGMYWPLVVYAYSIFKFEKINELKSGTDIAKAIISVVHTSIISTIMFFVFGILVLALAVMLVVRAVKLWAYAIFAPLFTFQFVAGSGMMWDNKDMFSIKEFIGLCFVPAVVWLSLSFWLIMIAAVQWTTTTWWSATAPCDLKQWCTITNIMWSPKNSIQRIYEQETDFDTYITRTTFTWGDMKVYFMGSAVNQKDTMSNTQGTIDSLGGMFGTLIIDVIALVFIWLAFMAAKNISTAVKWALKPFEDMGNQVGNLAKSLPKYTPLPIPGGSLSGLWKTAELTKSKFDTAMRAKEEKNIGKMFPGLVEWLIKAEDMAKLEKAMKENNSTASTSISNIAKAMGDAANKWNADKNIEAFWDRVSW